MPTAATAVEDSDPKLGQTHPHDFTKRLKDETTRNFIRQQLEAFATFIDRHGGKA
jgi:hypothetical protein